MKFSKAKKVLIMLLCLTLLIIPAGCKSSSTGTSQSSDSTAATDDSAASESQVTNATYTASIVVKDYGTITVALDASAAPVTVENFVKLANEGFYNGLTFHRIISGFMIQGGDPNHNGTGGSEETIKGEFAENGVENPISHVRGTISMARSNDYDSASSQFFICHQDSTFLDGQYAAFGTVTEGMEVVDQIAETAIVTDDNGTVEYENQPVIESITIS